MKTFVAIKSGKTRDTFLPKENIDLLEKFGGYSEVSGDFTPDNIAASIKDADIYMTAWGSPRLDSRILDAAPNLKLLVHLCGTVVPFISPEMWDRGIRVISGNAYFAESTAEGALSYIFAAQRDIPGYSYNLKNNKTWKETNSYSRSLLGKTVGVVSYGTVARNLIRMMQPFRVKILIYDIRQIPEEDLKKYNMEQVSLEELFSRSDIISVHTPLNEHTHHLITKELLELIKPDGLFVNTSRGKVIDENGLIEVLKEGKIRAALDVFTHEPPAADSPLYTLPNLLMMPHMSGPTVDLRAEIGYKMINEAKEYINDGIPLRNEISRKAAEMMSER